MSDDKVAATFHPAPYSDTAALRYLANAAAGDPGQTQWFAHVVVELADEVDRLRILIETYAATTQGGA